MSLSREFRICITKFSTCSLAQLTLFNFDAFVLQQLAKLLNLFLKLTDEFSVGILIDDGFANNLLGSVGISEEDKKKSIFICTLKVLN